MSALNWIWYAAGGFVLGWIIITLFDWSWFRRRRKPAQDPYSLVPTEPRAGKSTSRSGHEESAARSSAGAGGPEQTGAGSESDASPTADSSDADT